jgi:hypothetical protein
MAAVLDDIDNRSLRGGAIFIAIICVAIAGVSHGWDAAVFVAILSAIAAGLIFIAVQLETRGWFPGPLAAILGIVLLAIMFGVAIFIPCPPFAPTCN